MSGDMKNENLGDLSAQLKAANSTPLDDLDRALRILKADALPDPRTLPTRQQRRKAEREARKASR